MNQLASTSAATVTNLADEYQLFTRTTTAYPHHKEGDYLTAGLMGEMGEFMSAAAKYHRGDYDVGEFRKRAKAELGDLLWFIARLTDYYGWTLSEVMVENRDKLTDRMNRGVIRGDGDER